jgi:nucleotide-binding universal stress UspA family protein
MSSSILCAIDISDTGKDREVLKTAIKLARLDDVQLDVVTVVPDFGMSLVGGYFNKTHHDEMMSNAKEQLSAEVLETAGSELNAKIRHIVVFGKTYEEVLKTAKKANSSLIVVGAHKADLSEFLLGPNAARIVRHSTCSVYVVRI